MNTSKLNQFTSPSILKQIGNPRLTRFFRPFATCLQAANICWPHYHPGNDEFFVALAELLALPGFPSEPCQALARIERLAAPENADLLHSAFIRHLQDACIPTTSPTLEKALELWFCSPRVILELTDPLMNENPSLPAAPAESQSVSEIQHPESSNKHPESDPCESVLIRGSHSDSSLQPESNSRPSGPAAPKSDEGGSSIPGPKYAVPASAGPEIEISSDADPCPPVPIPSSGSVFIGGSEPSPIQNQKPSPREKMSSPYLTGGKIENHFTLDTPLWPDPVNGKQLLDSIVQILKRFVVLPPWAPETIALWIVHTYAFQLRDVSTYIGIESPEPRCGKTTLLTVLNALAYRAIPSANISPPALFRVIEDMCPTLLIDEADTFLHRNEQLQGIFNSGYKRDTAYVWRVAYESNSSFSSSPFSSSQPAPLDHEVNPHPASDNQCSPVSISGSEKQPIQNQKSKIANTAALARFSCWCPKAISQIGRLPRTLADRCIVIRIQRKTPHEQCDRLRELKVDDLKSQCARFVTDHQHAIGAARPPLPETLGDRAADIWEPLFALADLAGPEWGDAARNAALSLAAAAHDSNPIAALLTDICIEFFSDEAQKRIFSRDLVARLNRIPNRPWAELLRGKPMTELWLSDRLRPYGIRPRNISINSVQAKGYAYSDCEDAFRRYLTRADLTQRTGLPEDTTTPDAGNTDPPASK